MGRSGVEETDVFENGFVKSSDSRADFALTVVAGASPRLFLKSPMGDGDPTLPASGFRFFFNPIAIFVALYMPKVYVFLCCVVSGTAASTTTAPPVFCVTGEHEATAVTMVPTAMFLSSPAFPIPEAFAFASPVLGEAIGVRPTDAAAVAGDCVTADVTRDIPNVSHEAGPTTTTTERLPNSIDRDTF
tara:strand:+ start:63 stop:626 length:564 start_codon:yes stop_codon:yes gene_type:complete